MQKVIVNNYSCSSKPSTKSCGCITILSGDCVKYTGLYLENLNVQNGDTFNSALVKINNLINVGGSITTMDSPTIAFQGNGTPSQPLFAQFIGSTETPTLQEVTDSGNITTDIVTVGTLVTGGAGSNPKVILGYNPAYSAIVVDAQTSVGSTANLTLLGGFVTISALNGVIIASPLTLGTTADQILVRNTSTNRINYISVSDISGNFVTINTTQSISGSKTFTSQLNIQSAQSQINLNRADGVQAGIIHYSNVTDELGIGVNAIGGLDPTSIVLRHTDQVEINNVTGGGTGTITNIIFGDGRMSGTPATNNDEFVTLGQVGRMFSYTTSGNGEDTVFSIPHGYTSPTMVLVTPNSADCATGPFFATISGANVIINYPPPTVLPSGTDNLSWTIHVK